LGVFLVATFRLLPSTVKIIQSYGKIRYGEPSADLLKSELDQAKNEFYENKVFKIKKDFHFSRITFKNVSFKYPNTNKNILNNFSFEIKKGDKIGVIGNSGSGKSTFIDILTGLIVPTKGEIFLNDKLIELENKNWFNIIGYTPQFIFLSDNTILNNIAFGVEKKDLNMDKYKKATELSEIKEFIEGAKLGSDTFIGEFGVRLSGGQRQRIGIARSLYLDPEIIILDESTSAIDLQTEEKIINNINTLSDKTIIIVSHRLSTLKNCNKIIEIKKGYLEIKKA
jgi:ABC-type multidrug transport system fused ATPase/permease subunit